MEQKCLKCDVFVNETVFNDTTEQAIDIDFTLPDYCPDVSKIFKCQAMPRINSKGINGKTITIDGTIIITLLYADNDGKFCSYEYQYPFVKNIEMPEETSGVNLVSKIRSDYINCRAITGRKIDIHGAAGISVKVFKRQANEIVYDIEDPNIELRRDIAPATTPMGFAEKYLILDDEINVGQGQPAIESVLKVNSNVWVKETKVINDKAVVKGEMLVCILYCPEGSGNPQVTKSVLPYSQIVEIEGITEDCNCETKSEIAFLEVKPRVSSNGEVKSFMLNAKILLTCQAYCGNDIAVISDAFSRKFQTEIKKQHIGFDKITCNINEVYHCKKNIELESNINSVIDLWTSVQSCNTKFDDENMIISGIVIAGLIICDENNQPYYTEKQINFEYKYPFKASQGTPNCVPEISIRSCGYTISSANNMELRIDMEINAAIYEKSNISLITDLIIDADKMAERRSNGAMIVYFAGKDECVWDVASNFGAAVDEIMSINNLDSEMLTEGKMLLVPML